MCRFYSGYARKNEDGTIKFIDAFPFESHSAVPAEKRSDAVPVEAEPTATGLEFHDHRLPDWWNDDATAQLAAHIEMLKAKIEAYNATADARKARAKLNYQLRKLCADKKRRQTIIERAGHGSVETAMAHIAHVRSERAARLAREDELDTIRKNVTRKWLATLSDAYLLDMLHVAQSRCQARKLTLRELKAGIANAVATGERVTLGEWSVANAYYKYGTPTGTYAYIDPLARRPVQVRRGNVR